MTSIDVNAIAPPSSGNVWKPQVGDVARGEIVFLRVQAPKPSYDKKRMEQELRIDLVEGDTATTVYVTVNNDVEGDGYPKRDARAVANAVRAAGASQLEVGGYLAMQRVNDVPTQAGEAKDFAAEYRAPKPGVGVGLIAPEPGTPAPAPAPVAAPAPAPAPSLGSLIGD